MFEEWLFSCTVAVISWAITTWAITTIQCHQGVFIFSDLWSDLWPDLWPVTCNLTCELWPVTCTLAPPFSVPTVFWRRKKSNALVFWYSLFIEKYGLNNGNSLRMTEQEDISSCYFTIKETWSRYISYFAHASLYLPDFDTFVWRLPSGTQANSQVCFR